MEESCLSLLLPEFEPGARSTNDISIEFEIRPKFGVLQFKIYWSNHKEIYL